MASIIFSSQEAHERFLKCREFTESRGDKSLVRCLGNLMNWRRDIIIGQDFDPMSFTFRERLSDEEYAKGFYACNGGIIYHGARDGFGSGAAPTFSVTIEKTEGYSIHT